MTTVDSVGALPVAVLAPVASHSHLRVAFLRHRYITHRLRAVFSFLQGAIQMPVEGMSQEEVKKALKEGLTEWLDKQFATLGKWTLGGIASLGLAALAYAFFQTKGFGR
ncbi:hypothetical protein [Paraburkholderia sp. SIMBA_030]|uniref:hypothetical protein n=1 Tax=Paraburkholderia sp. SIMBA_030 TaxID=3085773 RepID=UPI00397C801E